MSNFIDDARTLAIHCIEDGEQILLEDSVLRVVRHSGEQVIFHTTEEGYIDRVLKDRLAPLVPSNLQRVIFIRTEDYMNYEIHIIDNNTLINETYKLVDGKAVQVGESVFEEREPNSTMFFIDPKRKHFIDIEGVKILTDRDFKDYSLATQGAKCNLKSDEVIFNEDKDDINIVKWMSVLYPKTLDLAVPLSNGDMVDFFVDEIIKYINAIVDSEIICNRIPTIDKDGLQYHYIELGGHEDVKIYSSFDTLADLKWPVIIYYDDTGISIGHQCNSVFYDLERLRDLAARLALKQGGGISELFKDTHTSVDDNFLEEDDFFGETSFFS